jgi:phospholipase/carboxylesterase
MQTHVMTLGGLKARVVEAPGARPELNLVLCHGYGAPGDDLVPLGQALLEGRPRLAAGVRCVFPEAPLSLDAYGMWGGRAWWHLDMARLLEPSEWPRLMDETPEGMPEARRMLESLVGELAAGTGLPLARTVLGGFSQGSMVATDLMLRAETSPAGLGILSGALVARPEWQTRAPARAGLPVFQSHGLYDDILPFAVGEALRDLLVGAGLRVHFAPFPGPHTILPEVLEGLADFLEDRLSAMRG